MSGSQKGRVIGPASGRGRLLVMPPRLTGVCAWCGADQFLPRDRLVRCLTCASTEIDWVDPPTPALPVPHVHTRDTHTPGSIAFSLLGGFVHPSRHGQ